LRAREAGNAYLRIIATQNPYWCGNATRAIYGRQISGISIWASGVAFVQTSAPPTDSVVHLRNIEELLRKKAVIAFRLFMLTLEQN
jgi:hypothetical protein